MPSYQSWGRLPKATPAAVRRVDWRSELADLEFGPAPTLPYGLGRSYGDSCLNDGGVLIDTSHLSRLIFFDSERGIVRAEAGHVAGEGLGSGPAQVDHDENVEDVAELGVDVETEQAATET